MLEIRQLDRGGDRVIGVLHKSESYDITETVFANLVNESNDFTPKDAKKAPSFRSGMNWRVENETSLQAVLKFGAKHSNA